MFLIGSTKEIWDKNTRKFFQYKYPDNVNEDTQTNMEDERRLFFVAMTRARIKLDISFSLQKENGKEDNASQFVDEVLAETSLKALKKDVDPELVEDFQYQILLKQKKEIQLMDHDLIDSVLEKYKLSVTGLNKYLKCPMSFYFETILRVPTARNKHMGFGRAIHRAFQLYFEDIDKGVSGDAATLIRYFSQGMGEHKSHFTAKEFDDLMAYGEMSLKKYFAFYMTGISLPKSIHLEYKIDNAECRGVPIKGVLDKVEIFKDYVEVMDYKTGNFENVDTKKKLRAPDEKNPDGGDYWRQIAFYKILLDSDKKHNWTMTSGDIDFVEPSKKTGEFSRKSYVVSPDDLEVVGDQIEQTWKNIHDHNFNQLCDDERCYWCNFVRNDYVFSEELEVDNLEDVYGE